MRTKEQTLFARKMRRQPTPAEQFLWIYLRNRRLENIKFRRQQPIGKYIVDFVSYEKKVVIELDGYPHRTELQKNKDLHKSLYLRSLNIQS